MRSGDAIVLISFQFFINKLFVSIHVCYMLLAIISIACNAW